MFKILLTKQHYDNIMLCAVSANRQRTFRFITFLLLFFVPETASALSVTYTVLVIIINLSRTIGLT